MNPRELRQRRAALIAQARAILEAAEKDKRSLTQEEDNRYTALFREADELRAQIERAERLETAERELDESQGTRAGRPEAETATEDAGEAPQRRQSPPAYRRAFRSFLRSGLTGIAPEEMRALQAENDVLGGFLVAPTQFVDALIQAVDNQLFVRRYATRYEVPNAATLGAASLDADPADADWTVELDTGSEDSAMAFGRRELAPKPLAKRIKVSRKLLRQVPDAEALVINRLAYKFAVSQEKAFLTGSGAGQPLGVFTASSDGISTGRDVSSQNTTTALTFEGLLNAKYALKGQYHANARWLFHRDAVRNIAKLRSDSGAGAGTGDFIWKESMRAGEPDTLLGLPIDMSEYVPNTFTTGLYVGLLADWRQYWIADATNFELQRLTELYAETNQVGMIGRLETDGMPVLEEAFVRVRLA